MIFRQISRTSLSGLMIWQERGIRFPLAVSIVESGNVFVLEPKPQFFQESDSGFWLCGEKTIIAEQLKSIVIPPRIKGGVVSCF